MSFCNYISKRKYIYAIVALISFLVSGRTYKIPLFQENFQLSTPLIGDFSLHAKPKKKPQKSLARRWFEFAYKMEKEAPHWSIEMYEWASTNGLGKERSLSDIAFWRLYYLYIQNERYLTALFHLDQIQKWERRKYKKKGIDRLRKKLEINMKAKWGLVVRQKEISLIQKIKRPLSKAQTQRLHSFWQKKLQIDSLRKEFLEILAKKNKISTARLLIINLLSKSKSKEQKNKIYLDLVELEIKGKNYGQAKKILSQLLGGMTDMKPEMQMQLYYNMGKIEENEKDYLMAGQRYQSAALFVQKKQMLRLYAHCLYLRNKFQKAKNILQKVGRQSNSEEEILWFVLQIKLTNKKIFRKRLKKISPYLQAKKKNKSNYFLVKEALALSQYNG